MEHRVTSRPWPIRILPVSLSVLFGMALAAGLFLVPQASAYEQVGNFAGTPGMLKAPEGQPNPETQQWPEEVQLAGVGGMAVNISGAGGVPAGTVYAATYFPSIGPS